MTLVYVAKYFTSWWSCGDLLVPCSHKMMQHAVLSDALDHPLEQSAKYVLFHKRHLKKQCQPAWSVSWTFSWDFRYTCIQMHMQLWWPNSISYDLKGLSCYVIVMLMSWALMFMSSVLMVLWCEFMEAVLLEDMPYDTERKPDRTQKRLCWKSEHLALHCSYCAVR